MFVDTHTHLHHKRFNKDRTAVFEQMRRVGVEKILEIPIDYESNFVMREKLRDWPDVKFAVGVHPTRLWKAENRDSWMKRFKEFAAMNNTTAIGEVGLDHHTPEREDTWGLQEEWFHRFIVLAQQLELPMVLHIREAYEDAVRILREHGDCFAGVVHCFCGTEEQAQELVNLGLCLGIGGAITMDCPGLTDAVRSVPIEKIVLETDSPFVTPTSLEGRNSPVNIPYIAKILADVEGMSAAEVERITTANALRLFRL